MMAWIETRQKWKHEIESKVWIRFHDCDTVIVIKAELPNPIYKYIYNIAIEFLKTYLA